MGTPETTHILTTLHFHPNALTELVEQHRAMISALHILAHAVGGEMWPTLVHSGALAAAEYGRDEIERLRAENERLRGDADLCEWLMERLHPTPDKNIACLEIMVRHGASLIDAKAKRIAIVDKREMELARSAKRAAIPPNASHQTAGGE